jgi:hypothetical protein
MSDCVPLPYIVYNFAKQGSTAGAEQGAGGDGIPHQHSTRTAARSPEDSGRAQKADQAQQRGSGGQHGSGDAGGRLPDASDAPPELQGGCTLPLACLSAVCDMHLSALLHPKVLCIKCLLLSRRHDDQMEGQAVLQAGSCCKPGRSNGLGKMVSFTAGAAEGGARRAQRASAEERRTAAEVLSGDRDGVERPEMLYPAGQGLTL